MILTSRPQLSQFLVVLLIGFPSTVLAGSRYANDDPKNCQIIGDTNIYGLGIRLAYYLQFTAAVLSPYLAPNQLSNICLSFGAITLASFAAVYENAVQGYFIAVDWHVTVMLTLGLGLATFFFNPGLREVTMPSRLASTVSSIYPVWTGGEIKKSFYGPWGAMSLLIAMDFLTAPWMYWKGNYQANKDDCNVYFYLSIGAFAFWVNIYNRKWIIAIKVLSVLGTFLGGLSILYGSRLLLLAGRTRITKEECTDTGSKWMRAVYSFVQLFVGGWTIALIEITLLRNDVDLSGTPITSSGQLIPLLMGALSLTNVFLTWFRYMAVNIGTVSAFETYVTFTSNIFTRVENFLGGQKTKEPNHNEETAEEVELMGSHNQASDIVTEHQHHPDSIHGDSATQSEEQTLLWRQSRVDPGLPH
jgi:hypothetical protein